MKKLTTILFLTFLLIAGARANHAAMIDINYRYIAGMTYEVTVVLYRNCLGSTAGAPNSLNLSARSVSLGVITSNAATLAKLPITGPNVHLLNPPNLMNCTNSAVCYEEYVYRGVVNLNNLKATPLAKDWIFAIDVCCRPSGSPGAVANVSAGSLYAECGLNNWDFTNGNDSPLFHDRRPNRPGHLTDTIINYPGIALCQYRERTHKQEVKEYEGDIIRYEYTLPDGGATTYINGFSASKPMNYLSPPGFKIDSITGHFQLAPDLFNGVQTYYLIGIKAIEKRPDTVIVGGVPTVVLKEIGYVKRNYMLLVDTISICPDLGFKVNTNSVDLLCSDNSMKIGMSNKITCESIDYDGSFVSMYKVQGGAVSSIDSVKPVNCFFDLVTDSFEIFLNQPLNAGMYGMVFQNGSDGNAVQSECGLDLPIGQDTVWISVDSSGLPLMLAQNDSMGNPNDVIFSLCGSKSIKVMMSESIQCNSIDVNGSDFVILDSNQSTPSVLNVSSAAPVNCKNNFTKEINIVLSQPIGEGKYGLYLRKGLDGNTLLGRCGLSAPSHEIGIETPFIGVDIGPDLTYCEDSTFYAILDAGAGFVNYKWNTGDKYQNIAVVNEGIYIVEVETALGCIDSDTVIVTEIDCSPWSGIAKNKKNAIAIYPNPAKNLLLIELMNNNITELTIVDQFGKEITSLELKVDHQLKYSLDVSTYSNGIYFVKTVDSFGNTSIKKLLINR